MYLLQERLGEEAVDRALREVIERCKFKGPPYPRSVDLIELFRQVTTTPEQQELITDLFERITLYDLRVQEPVHFSATMVGGMSWCGSQRGSST